MKTNFGNMYNIIKGAKSAAIIGHISPDGDCIGSCVALRLAFLQMGKTADIFIDDEIPETFSYMKDFDKVYGKDYISGNAWKKYDLLVMLDTSTDDDRIGRCAELRANAKKLLVVDHHENTSIKADVVVANTGRGSVCSILYEFFIENKIEITAEIAAALYTGVATDTGCFVHATNAFTHEVAAALIDTGIDVDMINYENFKIYDRKIIPVLGFALKNMKFFVNGEVAVIYLPYAIVKKYDLSSDMWQFKKYASEASGVRVGIVLTEKQPGEFVVSMRSHRSENVAAVAESYGGGGHKRAAGCIIRGKYNKVLKELLVRVTKCL